MKDKNKRIIFLAAVAAFFLAMAASLCLGAEKLNIGQLIMAIKDGKSSGLAGNIFWYVRFPRTMACLLAGAGLAVSGAVIQGVLANQLASPGIIGVNAGAGLAVTICCAFGVFGGWAVAGASFFGALLAVLLVAFTAQKTNASRTTVILGGVAVNSFLNAMTEAITTLFPDVGVMSADYRVGGFTSVVSERVIPAGILILWAIFVLMTLCF